jgi:hypothetical protein
MATADSGHAFNSDLLANEHDRELIETFGRCNRLSKVAPRIGGFH